MYIIYVSNECIPTWKAEAASQYGMICTPTEWLREHVWANSQKSLRTYKYHRPVKGITEDCRLVEDSLQHSQVVKVTQV